MNDDAYYRLMPLKDQWRKTDEISCGGIWLPIATACIGCKVKKGELGRRPIKLSSIFPNATPIQDINEHTEQNPNSHYAGYRVDDFIAAERLNFRRGNVVKYICRAGNKPGESELKELRKAFDYLDREIKMLEQAENE